MSGINPPKGSSLARAIQRMRASNGNMMKSEKMSEIKELEFKDSVNMFSTVQTSKHKTIKHPLLAHGLDAHYAFPPSHGKHYLPYDQKDADDFTFEVETDKDANDHNTPTRIVCQNPGKWEIINQYQLDCLKSGADPEQLSGFGLLGTPEGGNGVPIPNSSATCTVKEKGDKVVLVIAYTVDLKKGDWFKVGCQSSNPEVAIINSYPGVTGLRDPICITLCNKLKD